MGHDPAMSPAALIGPLTELAIAAGLAITGIASGDIGLREKADHSPLTAADLAADAIIAEGLGRIAPGIPVISEETVEHAPKAGDRFFLVDPLDGTREFAAGRDEYTVNIALIVDGLPSLGIVAAPARQVLWRGIPGSGVERIETDKAGAIRTRASVHARKRASGPWIAAVSRSHQDAATKAFLAGIGEVRQVVAGSALKLCLVAEGAADVYPRLGPTSEWDVAAGHALVEAAGGCVRRPDGGRLRYGGLKPGFRVDGFVAWGDPEAAPPVIETGGAR